MKSQVEKSGVFTEISNAGAPPPGFANLVVKATIRTHLENYYILEFKPVYKYKVPGRIPAFKKGPKEYEAYFNGMLIM